MCSDRLAAVLLAAGTSVLLAACTPVDPGFGEAVKYDQFVQTINPDPRYPQGGAQPGDSGAHGAKAVERYRKGEVKEVQVQSTASGTGTGGGSGGAGPR